MSCAQCFGADIVGLLHGDAAKAAAMVPPDDVSSDLSLAELCRGYGAHHFDAISNGFHAAGMLAAIVSLLVALNSVHITRGQRLLSLLWIPPQWYITAWVGHFWLQKDIPAVFTYGVQLRTLASGEFCSMKWVFSGEVFAEKHSRLVGGPVSFHHGFSLALALFVVMGTVTPAGKIWQQALSGGKPKAKKVIGEAFGTASMAAASMAVVVVASIAAANQAESATG